MLADGFADIKENIHNIAGGIALIAKDFLVDGEVVIRQNFLLTDDGCGTRSATASVGKKISDERK